MKMEEEKEEILPEQRIKNEIKEDQCTTRYKDTDTILTFCSSDVSRSAILAFLTGTAALALLLDPKSPSPPSREAEEDEFVAVISPFAPAPLLVSGFGYASMDASTNPLRKNKMFRQSIDELDTTEDNVRESYFMWNK